MREMLISCDILEVTVNAIVTLYKDTKSNVYSLDEDAVVAWVLQGDTLATYSLFV